jgi:hypothetical protein
MALKFKLKKGKGSVSRFTAADGSIFKPGDVVELPGSYRGERWLQVVEPLKKPAKPMRKVKKADVVPLEKPKQTKPKKKN